MLTLQQILLWRSVFVSSFTSLIEPALIWFTWASSVPVLSFPVCLLVPPVHSSCCCAAFLHNSLKIKDCLLDCSFLLPVSAFGSSPRLISSQHPWKCSPLSLATVPNVCLSLLENYESHKCWEIDLKPFPDWWGSAVASQTLLLMSFPLGIMLT